MYYLSRKINKAALAAFVIFMFVPLAVSQGDALFKHANLKIETGSGPAVLDVEVADTDPKREQGLMFRRVLAANHGMIFLFEGEQEITMWMKNTYISLDMVFISADWRISHIARNAEPQSTEIISSVQPASRVLEIAGGEADRLGLKPGDLVSLQR
jgi:hypothetical protein